MTNRSQAAALFEQIAKLGKALSSPQRLRILSLLCQCERTVYALSKAVGLPIATVSHHLQKLSQVRLVVARKVGRFVTYAMADNEVTAFWLQYRDFCSGRLLELQMMRSSLTDQRKSRGVVDQETLSKMLKKGTVALLDLRPQVEFDAGHLPEAISCPMEQLGERIKSLPKGKTIVLYCRGPLCLLGDIAQEQLAAKGISTLQFTDGVVEWAFAGRPVKKSPTYKSLFTPA